VSRTQIQDIAEIPAPKISMQGRPFLAPEMWFGLISHTECVKTARCSLGRRISTFTLPDFNDLKMTPRLLHLFKGYHSSKESAPQDKC
jgi:hypothetical protein